jgi:hypothetical protein
VLLIDIPYISHEKAPSCDAEIFWRKLDYVEPWDFGNHLLFILCWQTSWHNCYTINHPRSSHSAELRQARNHICSRVLPLCLANEVVLTAKSTCASRFISELPLNVEIYRGTALTHCRNGPKWVRTSFSHEWNSLSFRLSTLVLYHSVLM